MYANGCGVGRDGADRDSDPRLAATSPGVSARIAPTVHEMMILSVFLLFGFSVTDVLYLLRGNVIGGHGAVAGGNPLRSEFMSASGVLIQVG